ncbi:unnamed protein product, partial [Didymodactylos carnosus]
LNDALRPIKEEIRQVATVVSDIDVRLREMQTLKVNEVNQIPKKLDNLAKVAQNIAEKADPTISNPNSLTKQSNNNKQMIVNGIDMLKLIKKGTKATAFACVVARHLFSKEILSGAIYEDKNIERYSFIMIKKLELLPDLFGLDGKADDNEDPEDEQDNEEVEQNEEEREVEQDEEKMNKR